MSSHSPTEILIDSYCDVVCSHDSEVQGNRVAQLADIKNLTLKKMTKGQIVPWLNNSGIPLEGNKTIVRQTIHC